MTWNADIEQNSTQNREDYQSEMLPKYNVQYTYLKTKKGAIRTVRRYEMCHCPKKAHRVSAR